MGELILNRTWVKSAESFRNKDYLLLFVFQNLLQSKGAWQKSKMIIYEPV